MEALKTVKEMLTWISVCQPNELTSNSKKITRLVFSQLIFAGHLYGFLAHLAYIFKIGLNDLEGSVNAFMGTVGFICVTYVLTTVFIFRERIEAIFKQLSEIYNTRKFSNSLSNDQHHFSLTLFPH